MNWSAEQQAIFSSFRKGSGNLVVEALAGTGKTTTITEAFKHAPESRILYAVFNKKNQKEAAEKIADHRVDVLTLHSLGYRFIKRLWPKAQPDDDVELDRTAAALQFANLTDEEYKMTFAMVLQLVGFAKNLHIDPSLEDLAAICQDRDIDFSMTSVDGCQVALSVMQASKQKDPRSRISFNDMVWLPCAMNLVKPIYDLVVVDEAQDMNMPQLTMARKASKGRVVVVGDSRQAIYGFRGAASNGMGMMKITLRAKTLTLSTTYRCPKSVVEMAREFVPLYTAAESNAQGTVSTCSQANVCKQAAVGDAILSRLNAPLMPMALQLLRANIPARVEGRDIAKQLMSMVRSFKAKSVPDYITKVEGWRLKSLVRIENQKNADRKAEVVNDTADTLVAIAEGAKGVSEIQDRIDNLFQDTDGKSRPAVILSSVHKAKGLEWNRVFILVETFRKGKGQEEDNIYYVAITRTKKELYLVGGSLSTAVANPSMTQETQPATPVAVATPVENSQPQTILEVTQSAKSPTKVIVAPKPDPFSLPSGNMFHQIGNVISHKGGEWVCTRVSDCNATFVSLGTVSVDLTYTDDEGNEHTKTITKKSKAQTTLSNNHNPLDELVLRKMTEAEVKNFLTSGKARQSVGEQTKHEPGQERQTVMPKTKTAKKDRPSYAGRAEYIHSLRYEKKMSKSDARDIIDKKYPGTSGSKVFDEMWDAKPKAAKTAKKATAKAPAKKAPTAKAKPKSSPPPPRATPPPPATPAPAATEQPAAPATT